MKRAKVIVADDHAIVLEGLRRVLEPDYEVAAVVENGRDLIRKAEELDPEVLIVDITMPLLNGIDAVRQIKKNGFRGSIIILTMHPDVAYATAALEAGAAGYVLKHAASSELLTALREVLRGRTYLTPRIEGDVMDELRRVPRRPRRPVELTTRQREVLQLLAEGHTLQETADILHISPRTVEYHKYGMMRALGLKSSAELTQLAIKEGLVGD